MASLQTQTLHSENNFFQHTRQRVGEGYLGCHLFTDHSVSQRLKESELKSVTVTKSQFLYNRHGRYEWSGNILWCWGQVCGAWRWFGWLILAGSLRLCRTGLASALPDPPAGSDTAGRAEPTQWFFLRTEKKRVKTQNWFSDSQLGYRLDLLDWTLYHKLTWCHTPVLMYDVSHANAHLSWPCQSRPYIRTVYLQSYWPNEQGWSVPGTAWLASVTAPLDIKNYFNNILTQTKKINK